MPTQEPTIPIPTPGDNIESVFTQQHVLNATYTAVKEEGTVPPCENSVVTVTSTYQMEYTLADGYDLSNIVTDNLEEGSIAHVGSDTYIWDGTQWVLQGGGGMSALCVNFTIDFEEGTATADKTFAEISAAFNANIPIYGYDGFTVFPLVFLDDTGVEFQLNHVGTEDHLLVSIDLFIDTTDACTFVTNAYTLTLNE